MQALQYLSDQKRSKGWQCIRLVASVRTAHNTRSMPSMHIVAITDSRAVQLIYLISPVHLTGPYTTGNYPIRMRHCVDGPVLHIIKLNLDLYPQHPGDNQCSPHNWWDQVWCSSYHGCSRTSDVNWELRPQATPLNITIWLRMKYRIRFHFVKIMTNVVYWICT